MSDKFDVLTRVGPGTPAGDLFRQFWLPVAKSSEFEAGGEPIRLMALGERLVGFRDTQGQMGILDLQSNTKDWYGRWRLTPSEDNDYFLDRDAQRNGNYTGIDGIQIQDTAITESMGPIVDRSGEHLCGSDLMISRTRRRLLKAVEAYAASGETPVVLDEPELCRHVRSGGDHLPPGTDWIEFYREKIRTADFEPRVLESDTTGASVEVLQEAPA
jgi:Rieske oxygenase family protein